MYVSFLDINNNKKVFSATKSHTHTNLENLK